MSKSETVAKQEAKDVSAKSSGAKSKSSRTKSSPLTSGEFAREAALVAKHKELYNVKKGEFGAIKKRLKQKRAKTADLQKQLRSNFRKLTDEKALLELQKEYGSLLAKEAVILAETEDAMMRMSLSPFQYRDVEPMLDHYQQLLFD